MHITAQHASDDDNDSADMEVLLDNSPTSTVVLRKGDTTRIKITNSSMTIMALVADNIILSRAEAERPLFVRERPRWCVDSAMNAGKCKEDSLHSERASAIVPTGRLSIVGGTDE